VDSQHSHKAWVNSELGGSKIPLASDMTQSVSKDYGVLIEEEGISLRGLFIISPEGIIEYSVTHNLDIGRNIDEVIRVLHALQTKGACPVNWEEGDDLL